MGHMGPNIELILLGVLVCIVAYSLLTKAISKTILTLPIIFVAIGYVCAPVTHSLGTTEELRGSARLLAEITLVLVLFSDASHVRFSRLKTTFAIPFRSLVEGPPKSPGGESHEILIGLACVT